MPGSSPCSAVPFDGIDGNVSQDPLFSEEDDYQPADDSPVIDSGDPELLDGDASRSDMGIWGGPQAGRSEP